MSNNEQFESTGSKLKEAAIITIVTILVVGLLPLLAVLGLALQVGFAAIAPVLLVGSVSYALLTRAEPVLELIHGVILPNDVAFHRSHTWVRRAAKSKRCMVVGIDDLARRLIGHAEAVDILEPGTEVSRGQVVGTLRNGHRELPIVAPIDGTIATKNPVLDRDIEALWSAPYDRGWLFEMTPQKKPLKGLIRGEHSLRWMRDEVDRLAQIVSPAPVPALADGAVVDDDIGASLDDGTWGDVVFELVLSEQ